MDHPTPDFADRLAVLEVIIRETLGDVEAIRSTLAQLIDEAEALLKASRAPQPTG